MVSNLFFRSRWREWFAWCTRSFLLGSLLTAVAVAANSANAAPVKSAPEKPLVLTLLHINDHHSHLDETTLSLNLRGPDGQRQALSVPAGGFARIVAAIRQLESARPNPIKVHAGDAISGDLYYTLNQGRADADLMNAVCFDTLTLGNHEFDFGDDGLHTFLQFLNGSSCETAVLSANVVFGSKSPLHAKNAGKLVQASQIIERDGHQIGFIGVTAAYKTQNASRPSAGTRFEPELASVQNEIDRLKALGVRHIVVQSHQGYEADVAMARQLRGVNAIVGGDSHSFLGPKQAKAYGLLPEGPYPTRTTNADGELVCIVQAGHYGYFLGEIQLLFNADGRLQQCDGHPHLLIGEPRPTQAVAANTDAFLQAAINDVSESGFITIIEPDAEAQKRLQPYKQAKQEFGSEIVANALEPLCSRRVPGSYSDVAQSRLGERCNADPHVRAHGGDIQQWVAEIYRRQAKTYFETDIALINGGGVRIDIAPGPIRVNDVYTLLPFQNHLVQLRINGQQLIDAIESAIDNMITRQAGSGAYPYAAGLRWTLDTRQAKGKRLQNIEVMDANGNYRAFDPQATYAVATISFLAEGKDNYEELANVADSDRLSVKVGHAQVVLEYLLNQADAPLSLQRLPTKYYSTQEFIE